MSETQPYQVMPPLDAAEYDALKASIAAGYDPARPVVVDEDGSVLDGHHRQQVCAELGITAPVVVLPGLTEEQKHDYALRSNLACRHLSQLQKRELIAAELKRDPGRSNREIGRLCGADHKTVGAVRRELDPGNVTIRLPELLDATRECRQLIGYLLARITELGASDAGPPPLICDCRGRARAPAYMRGESREGGEIPHPVFPHHIGWVEQIWMLERLEEADLWRTDLLGDLLMLPSWRADAEPFRAEAVDLFNGYVSCQS